MPWHIEEGYESCSGYAVVKDSDGSVAGCHETEEAAKKQLAALYASEPEARAAKYDHIDFTPPSGVKAEARKGLEWRREFGRGGTGVGIARARDLSNGVKISAETARRMKAFFDRHQSDRNAEGWSPGEKGFPSNGRIAHALWGGDAGYAWSRKLVRQMNAADAARSIREFLEERGFCPTGSGGGIDNSCSSKDGGGGGDSGGGGDFGGNPAFKGSNLKESDFSKPSVSTPGNVVGVKNIESFVGEKSLHEPPKDRLAVSKDGGSSRIDNERYVGRQEAYFKAEGLADRLTAGGWKPHSKAGNGDYVFQKGSDYIRLGEDSGDAVVVVQAKSPPPREKLPKSLGQKKGRDYEMQAEARGFCPTGTGGGVDNSCSSKGGSVGSGGSDEFGSYPKGYEAGPSLTGKGAISGYHGTGGPGPKGATHEVKVDQDGKGGWKYTSHQLEADGLHAVYDTIKNEGGFKDRDSALAAATSGLPPVNPGAYKASVDGSWKPDFSKKAPNPFSRKPGKPGRPGRLPKPKKRDHEMQIETRSLCLDDFSEDDAFPLLKIERRCCEQGEDGPEETWLVGYAARFGATSLKMDDFYERIDPGAFSIVTERRGRKSPLETRALFNHDPNHLLGRYPGTLRMKVDEHGLRYEIKMPESQRGLVESIERGDIRGSSFSFIISPGGEEWSVEEGRSIRTVKSIASLIDVGPVTFPAYPDASVAVARRSYDEFIRGRAARSAEIEAIRQRKAEIEKFLRERGR